MAVQGDVANLLVDGVQVAQATLDANGNYTFTYTLNDQNSHNFQVKFPQQGNDNACQTGNLQLAAVPPPNHNTAISLASSANPPTVGVPFNLSGQVTETS